MSRVSVIAALVFCGEALASMLSPTYRVAAAPVTMKTYTYKRVGDLQIKADVYRADDTTIRPVLAKVAAVQG